MFLKVVLLISGLVGTLVAKSVFMPKVNVQKNDNCFKFQMSDVPGFSEVYFKYVLNSLLSGERTFRVSKAEKEGDDSWVFEDLDLASLFQPGDQMQYSAHAWGDDGLASSEIFEWFNAPEPTLPDRKLRGAVAFREDFNGNSLDRNLWNYEVSMYGGMNWEFQVYTNDKSNVFLQNGNLVLKPTLTTSDPRFSEAFLTSGTMDVAALWGSCTNNANYGCFREGKYGLLPPVMSGKIKTIPTIRYGSVEVRARIPKGDWIWPAIWMLPKDNHYGTWPRSGEIDIMESRGNTKAQAGGVNHGVNEVSSTLHWGTDYTQNKYALTHQESRKSSGDYASSFHTWRLDWSPEHIITYIDGHELLHVTPPSGGFYELGKLTGDHLWGTNSKIAPFDQDFYLILNVAVGGTNSYFPDTFQYNTPKPWLNTSPHAGADFWGAKNTWHNTWHGNSVAMEVDYVEFRHP